MKKLSAFLKCIFDHAVIDIADVEITTFCIIEIQVDSHKRFYYRNWHKKYYDI